MIQMSNTIAAVISGLLSGMALGLTGSGGSVLALPFLIYLVGLDPHLAIGTSLIAVGVTSLIGSVQHMKNGNVLFKMALLMGSTAIVGVYIGSYLNKGIKGPILLILFSLLMIATAIKMVGTKENRKEVHVVGTQSANHLKILGLGFIVGTASGFFGVGGGFLIVPALLWGAKIDMHKAVGTSLFIIFLNGIAGLISYEVQGRPVDLSITALFVVGGILGGIIGARIGTNISEKNLKYVFGGLVVVIATYMLVLNILAIGIL